MDNDAVPSLETDFGVPFAGVTRPRAGMDANGPQAVSRGEASGLVRIIRPISAVVLDVGCGNGRYLLGSVSARAELDHFGLDTLPVVIRYARRHGNQRGLTNLKYAVGGGRELLADHVSPSSVAEIHCYHPQPYYDPAQIYRRLITPAFLALVIAHYLPAGSSSFSRTIRVTGAIHSRCHAGVL